MFSLLSWCQKLFSGISSNKNPYEENIQEVSGKSLSPTLGKSSCQFVDGLYMTANEQVPAMQRAVVTPRKQKTLNQTMQTIAVQEPTAGEVVVRILYTGICCSDSIFSLSSDAKSPESNHIAGHEGIGYVVKSYDRSTLGKCVGIRYIGFSCGSCKYCVRGLSTSCPFQQDIPIHHSGTFQQYVTIPASCLIFFPDGLLEGGIDPALYASALCSGSTGLTSLKAASLKPGDVVIVTGIAGGIGHLTGAIAKKVFQAKVIGIDLASKMDTLPQEWEDYSDIRISPPVTNHDADWSTFHSVLLAACEELRGGQGVRHGADAIIVTSSSFSSFHRLDRFVCDGGRIICVGVPKGENMLQIPLRAVVERNLHLSGNLMGGHEETFEVIELIRMGVIRPFVKKLCLEDVPSHLQDLVDCRGVGKYVVQV